MQRVAQSLQLMAERREHLSELVEVLAIELPEIRGFVQYVDPLGKEGAQVVKVLQNAARPACTGLTHLGDLCPQLRDRPTLVVRCSEHAILFRSLKRQYFLQMAHGQVAPAQPPA